MKRNAEKNMGKVYLVPSGEWSGRELGALKAVKPAALYPNSTELRRSLLNHEETVSVRAAPATKYITHGGAQRPIPVLSSVSLPPTRGEQWVGERQAARCSSPAHAPPLWVDMHKASCNQGRGPGRWRLERVAGVTRLGR